MSDISWLNLDSPEVVCGTFTYEEDAEKILFRLAKIVKASGKTKQYGVFVEPYGNVYRVVVRDRYASEKTKRTRREKRAAQERARREESTLCRKTSDAWTPTRAVASVLCSAESR